MTRAILLLLAVTACQTYPGNAPTACDVNASMARFATAICAPNAVSHFEINPWTGAPVVVCAAPADGGAK